MRELWEAAEDAATVGESVRGVNEASQAVAVGQGLSGYFRTARTTFSYLVIYGPAG
jgi:hypothetical protein